MPKCPLCAPPWPPPAEGAARLRANDDYIWPVALRQIARLLRVRPASVMARAAARRRPSSRAAGDGVAADDGGDARLRASSRRRASCIAGSGAGSPSSSRRARRIGKRGSVKKSDAWHRENRCRRPEARQEGECCATRTARKCRPRNHNGGSSRHLCRPKSARPSYSPPQPSASAAEAAD